MIALLGARNKAQTHIHPGRKIDESNAVYLHPKEYKAAKTLAEIEARLYELRSDAREVGAAHANARGEGYTRFEGPRSSLLRSAGTENGPAAILERLHLDHAAESPGDRKERALEAVQDFKSAAPVGFRTQASKEMVDLMARQIRNAEPVNLSVRYQSTQEEADKEHQKSLGQIDQLIKNVEAIGIPVNSGKAYLKKSETVSVREGMHA